MAAGIAMAMAIIVSRALKSQPESPRGSMLQQLLKPVTADAAGE
jgi:hypothetical protein